MAAGTGLAPGIAPEPVRRNQQVAGTSPRPRGVDTASPTESTSMYPERADANRNAVLAQSPRLFGVPVPARAFGFAPGWQLPSRCWSTIDLREGPFADECQIEDAVRVMSTGMDAVQSLMRTAPPVGNRSKRSYDRSHRTGTPATPMGRANLSTTDITTRVEVAAA